MSASKFSARPPGVTFLAIVNGIGLVVTLLFWAAVLFGGIAQRPWDLTEVTDRANAATTWGFGIGDLLWSSILLLASFIGLLRLTTWGWTAAQMTNALWVYSMTVVIIRDSYSRFTPGTFVFTPFAVIALWATAYLWSRRGLFWKQALNKGAEA